MDLKDDLPTSLPWPPDHGSWIMPLPRPVQPLPKESHWNGLVLSALLARVLSDVRDCLLHSFAIQAVSSQWMCKSIHVSSN